MFPIITPEEQLIRDKKAREAKEWEFSRGEQSPENYAKEKSFDEKRIAKLESQIEYKVMDDIESPVKVMDDPTSKGFLKKGAEILEDWGTDMEKTGAIPSLTEGVGGLITEGLAGVYGAGSVAKNLLYELYKVKFGGQKPNPNLLKDLYTQVQSDIADWENTRKQLPKEFHSPSSQAPAQLLGLPITHGLDLLKETYGEDSPIYQNTVTAVTAAGIPLAALGVKSAITPRKPKGETPKLPGTEEVKVMDDIAPKPTKQGELELLPEQLRLDGMEYPDPYQGPPAPEPMARRQGTQLELPLRPDEPAFGGEGYQYSLGERGGMGPEGFVDQPPLSQGNLEALTTPRGEGRSIAEEAGITPRGEGEVPPSAVRDLFAEQEFLKQNPEFDFDTRVIRRRDNLRQTTDEAGPLDPQTISQIADARGTGAADATHIARGHTDPLWASKQAGAINPDLLLPNWLQKIADDLGRPWRENRNEFGARVLDKFKGIYDDATIGMAIFLGRESPNRQTWLLPPELFARLTSAVEEGASSTLSTKLNKIDDIINKGNEEGRHLRGMPTIYVDKIPDGKGGKIWQVVDHNGRHRSMALQRAGVTHAPVVVIDRTGGRFNIERPETIRTQQLQTVKTPEPLFEPRVQGQPLGGVGHQQGGAADFPALIKGVIDLFKKSPDGIEKLMQIYADTRNFDEMSKDIPTATTDIRKQGGWATASWRTTNPLLRNPKDPGYKFTNWINNKLFHANLLEHELKNKFSTEANNFAKYYGSLRTPWSVFINDLKIVRDFEKRGSIPPGQPGNWFDGKNYYPTKQQLEAAGLSPEAATIWEGIYKIEEASWPLLKEASKNLARPLTDADRIPGYLPKVYKGPWAVVIHNKKGGFVAEYNYHSRDAARRALEAANKNIQANPNNNWVATIEEPKPVRDTGAILTEIMGLSRKLSAKGSPMTNLLDAIMENSAIGSISHALERRQGRYGDILSRAELGLQKDNIFGLTRKDMKEAVQLFRDYQEAVVDFYVRNKFLNESLFPAIEAGYLDLPNVRNAVKDMVHSYIKISDSYVKQHEATVTGMLQKLGVSNEIIQTISNSTYKGIAMYSLMANWPFYLVNMFQWTSTPVVLQIMKAHGGRGGSITKAVLDTTKMMDGVVLGGRSKNQLLAWAREHGVTDPAFLELVQPGRVKDPVVHLGETRSRGISFLMAYNYYKQIMPHEQALLMGAKVSEMVGVPYSAHYGAPTAISNTVGTWGRPLMMFTTFASHSLGILAHAAERSAGNVFNTIKDKGVYKVPKEFNWTYARQGLAGIAGLSALGFALWGVNGAPFAHTYNNFVYLMQQLFGVDLPTTKELSRQMELGEIGEQGMVSSAMGFDISGSAGGASLSNPVTLFTNFLKTLLDYSILLGKGITTGRVNRQDIWKASQHVSNPTGKLIIERFLESEKASLTQPTWDWINGLGDQPSGDFAHYRDIDVPRGRERTNKESAVYSMFGIKSTAERQAEVSNQIFERESALKSKKAEGLIRYLKENVHRNTITEPEFAHIMLQLVALGVDPSTKLSAIVDYSIQARLTKEQQMLLGISGVESINDYLRYKDIKSKEPNQQGVRNGTR